MAVDINNIRKNLEFIGSSFNSGIKGFNRLAFSQEEKDAINWLEQELKDHDISVRRDAVGNLFARIGPDDAPIHAFGSHLDTVAQGGLFDGALGVITGLECLLKLKTYQPRNTAYELVCFVGEEVNPLGGTFGSRLIAGLVDVDGLDEEVLDKLGMTKEQLKEAAGTLSDYDGFLELHIEQGTVLENNGNKTGIVTSIAGIVRHHITVIGEAGHSGTMPMADRRDALVMASEIIQHINQEANKFTDGTVATVGQLEVEPNLATVIPGRVTFTFEVRSGDRGTLDMFPEQVTAWVKKNYDVEIIQGVVKPTHPMSRKFINAAETAGKTLGLPTMKLMSGANHDTNTLAPFMDTGMIFVPSEKGISHNPLENSEWEYIENAANIMLETLKNFDVQSDERAISD
ncbi:Zn-dependent hydrolase [Salinicoccus kekensis]|uniref:Allantoate deiminase/N-carbamoyl-L-amino-acid hydrolase n=1 Tax=Salinicoccus kekensis TaxID=714307 RepID=A0A285UPQ0_9STAP|nr:Zn-dependent hydrolase [Salinicoccus kekensis]SOC43733.1 allantoate deiminase/N-carbamoyl-L-amino-acid hydrolase [Salinicoccus kekensis]